MGEEKITHPKVWVAYATPEQQFHIEVNYVDGMTALDAILKSGIENLVTLPEQYSLGIFGTKIKDQNQILQMGDRVEIYRVLTINPKDIRRNRAAANPVGNYCRGNRFKQLK
ncbi:RnfH family protein [Acinetobacter sp. ANC 4648]|uniref:RnfH family protein n=1 Tax=Acinetobacter sp. ANC 4648 TaxID=1977875 RepID=UPI00148A7810|nr:RnfH family protein [Acinetobacter sp. ANC 4648]